MLRHMPVSKVNKQRPSAVFAKPTMRKRIVNINLDASVSSLGMSKILYSNYSTRNSEAPFRRLEGGDSQINKERKYAMLEGARESSLLAKRTT